MFNISFAAYDLRSEKELSSESFASIPCEWLPDSYVKDLTCWERADLLALVCGVYCEFVAFPLVSWVR